MRKLAYLLFLMILTIPCQAGVIYVDANTPDNNDGSSWGKAYKYLQDGKEELLQLNGFNCYVQKRI